MYEKYELVPLFPSKTLVSNQMIWYFYLYLPTGGCTIAFPGLSGHDATVNTTHIK